MYWFLFGIGLVAGALLAIPLASIAAKREAQRVRQSEQRARASDRLAELGTLTGGLAHEIKNPLSTIGLNAQLLQEDLREIGIQVADNPKPRDQIGRTQRRLESLSQEIQRLRDILEDFLRFAGRVKLDRVHTDLHELIDELVDFFTPQAHANKVHLRAQQSNEPAELAVDIGLLKQALLNLLINASQAMAEARHAQQPHGGCDELIIRTERSRSDGQEEFLIHVTDTGPGIPQDQLDKVFHPYFSQKKNGTGLGLPTARRIIEEHGGTLMVHSELGRGSDFIVTLPADDEPVNDHADE